MSPKTKDHRLCLNHHPVDVEQAEIDGEAFCKACAAEGYCGMCGLPAHPDLSCAEANDVVEEVLP